MPAVSGRTSVSLCAEMFSLLLPPLLMAMALWNQEGILWLPCPRRRETAGIIERRNPHNMYVWDLVPTRNVARFVVSLVHGSQAKVYRRFALNSRSRCRAFNVFTDSHANEGIVGPRICFSFQEKREADRLLHARVWCTISGS